MTQDTAGDSARRRLQAWLPRAPEEPELPAPPAPRAALDLPLYPGDRTDVAGAPELQALLAELDDLRLLLSADLGLVASAVDAGAVEVARDVVAGTQDDLAVFGLRIQHRLRSPEPGLGSRAGAADATEPLAAVVPSPPRARRSRRLAVLAPVLTAAAALVGLLSGVVPPPATASGPDRSGMTSAAASYAELWRLHEQGAPAPDLARVARRLHAEVARLVELAGLDPATAQQALRLLELELKVLEHPQHGGALAAELAESQRLVAVLRNAVLGSSATVPGDRPPLQPATARSAPRVARPAASADGPAPAAAARTGGSLPGAAPSASHAAGPPAEKPRPSGEDEDQQQARPAAGQQPSPSASPSPRPSSSPPPQEPGPPPQDAPVWLPTIGPVLP